MDGNKTKTLPLPNLGMVRGDGSWAALDGNCHTLQKMPPFFKVSNPDVADKPSILNGCWVWERGCFNRMQIEEEPNVICKLQAEAWTYRFLLSLESLTPWDLHDAQGRTQMLQPLSRHSPPQLPCHAHDSPVSYISLCLSYVIWTEDLPLAQEMFLAQHLSKH